MKRRAREYVLVAPLLLAAVAAIAAGVIAGGPDSDSQPPGNRRPVAGSSTDGRAVRLVDLQDPWGRAYYYRCPGVHDPEGYDLWSAGPDGISGTRDDITNWTSE